MAQDVAMAVVVVIIVVVFVDYVAVRRHDSVADMAAVSAVTRVATVVVHRDHANHT